MNKQFQIASFKFNSKVVLAPMAGVTCLAYREFMKPFGVAYSVTEMVSDAGISYHNKKTIEYLKSSKKDRPYAIQLFGHDFNITKKAIDIINDELKIKYDFLDINLGCPVRKVFKTGSGSALLQDLDYLYKYICSVVNYSKKPVTCKIRLGVDENHINVFDVVKVLEKAGVSAIAIHARTTKQLYSGKPNFNLIKDLGLTMNIPLIISGDIFTLDDAINALNITKASAVMVARGGIGNPYLITQINEYFNKGKKLENVTINKSKKYCKKLAKMIIKEKGEKTGISMLKGIAPRFFTKYTNAKKIRSEIAQNIKNYKDLKNILKNFK